MNQFVTTGDSGFKIDVIKRNGKVNVRFSRSLTSIELLEITANFMRMVPDDMRQLVFDVINNAIDTKEKKVYS